MAGPPKWAVDCHNGDGRPWILFFDELTCNAPAVQAAMLGVITEKRVGDDWAHEFRQWEQALDLPDPEEVLAKAMAAIGAGRPVEDGFLPGRADQVLALMVRAGMVQEGVP